MTDAEKSTGGYEVGYKKPPAKAYRSGWSRGETTPLALSFERVICCNVRCSGAAASSARASLGSIARP